MVVTEPFLPVGAPIHRRRLSRLETALAARRNVLELIPALSYRQPIVTGEMLMRWHMLADPAGMKRVMLDNLSNYPKSEIMRRMLRPARAASSCKSCFLPLTFNAAITASGASTSEMFIHEPFDDYHECKRQARGHITQLRCAKRLKFLPSISEARTYKGL